MLAYDDLPDRPPPNHDARLPLGEPFTLAQAERLGVSRDVLRRMVRDGLLRRVLPGVFIDSAATDDITVRARALGLVLPDHAVATDRTAAWLHGVDVLAPGDHIVPPPLQFFVLPGNARVRKKAGGGGERTLLPHEIELVQGVPVTTPLRTACDLGRLLHRDHAIGGIDALLSLRRFTHDELLSDVERYRGMRGVVQLRALAPLADARAESPGESVLRLRWIDAGLPLCRPQVEVRDDHGFVRAYVDLGAEELRLGAEYDGRDFHTSEADRARDRRRRAWLRDERGWTIRVFTREDVFGRHPTVARVMWSAYRSLRRAS